VRVGNLVRYKTKRAKPETDLGIVLRKLPGYETSDIMFANEIITCDWEDLEVVHELR
tara:strand:- start:262 stop:432 length:171 start_codon:yes stop_codon:yes gene_type:complete